MWKVGFYRILNDPSSSSGPIGETGKTLDTRGGNVRAIRKRRTLEEVGKHKEPTLSAPRDAESKMRCQRPRWNGDLYERCHREVVVTK
jgi:hypothetical protein